MATDGGTAADFSTLVAGGAIGVTAIGLEARHVLAPRSRNCGVMVPCPTAV